jgi:hypothetical protein
VHLNARARELKGRGQARALIVSSLAESDGGGTRVELEADIALSGRVGQFGRAAADQLMSELVDRFAQNLNEVLRPPAQPEPAPAIASTARPREGVRLLPILAATLRRRLRRAFRRLAGKGAGA